MAGKTIGPVLVYFAIGLPDIRRAIANRRQRLPLNARENNNLG